MIDYCGFLCMALNADRKQDVQIMQNDILQICNKCKLSDKVLIELLQRKAKQLSLEQRRQKHYYH